MHKLHILKLEQQVDESFTQSLTATTISASGQLTNTYWFES